jgi:hypothetical protein
MRAESEEMEENEIDKNGHVIKEAKVLRDLRGAKE